MNEKVFERAANLVGLKQFKFSSTAIYVANGSTPRHLYLWEEYAGQPEPFGDGAVVPLMELALNLRKQGFCEPR